MFLDEAVALREVDKLACLLTSTCAVMIEANIRPQIGPYNEIDGQFAGRVGKDTIGNHINALIGDHLCMDWGMAMLSAHIEPDKNNHGFHLPGSKINAQDINSVGYRAGGGLQVVADPEVLEVWGCRRPCLGCSRDEIRGEQEIKDQDAPDSRRRNRAYPSHDLLITDFIGT